MLQQDAAVLLTAATSATVGPTVIRFGPLAEVSDPLAGAEQAQAETLPSRFYRAEQLLVQISMLPPPGINQDGTCNLS
jgi:hypothetical protein